MYISNKKRFFKVCRNLVLNPSYLIPYLKFSLSSNSLLELELPWWTFESINEIKLYLNKQKNVFEWGSGGSSVFLAQLVNSIVSVENNPKWTELVKSTLQEKN